MKLNPDCLPRCLPGLLALAVLLPGAARADDCDQLARQAQQSEQFRSALKACPRDYTLRYRYGLHLLQNERFAEADAALREADSLLDAASGDYAANHLQVTARQVQNLWYWGKRGEAVAMMKSVLEYRRKKSLSLPSWVQQLQRTLDDGMDSKPLNASEMRGMVKSARAFGVEGVSVEYRNKFDYDSDHVTDEGKRLLEQVAAGFAGVEGRIRVVGHTDTQGDASYNRKLSERRAGAVREALLRLDASLANRLSAEGKGESEPRYPGDGEEDHRLNRRVEFVLDGKS